MLGKQKRPPNSNTGRLTELGKKIQLLFPAEYGESKFVMFPGGLHIDKAVLCVAGDLVDGTGWDAIIAEAEVATPGVAKSMLKVSHLMRTRNAYQVFLLALYVLKKKPGVLSRRN